MTNWRQLRELSYFHFSRVEKLCMSSFSQTIFLWLFALAVPVRSCYVGVSSYNEKFRWGYVRSEMSCREKSFVNFLSSDYCHSNYCWIQSQFFNKNVPGTSTSPTKELLTEEFHRVNLIVRLFPGFAGLQSKIAASHSSKFFCSSSF